MAGREQRVSFIQAGLHRLAHYFPGTRMPGEPGRKFRALALIMVSAARVIVPTAGSRMVELGVPWGVAAR